MSQVIKLRRSATPGNVPTTGELNLGELAINTNDGRLFTLKSVSGSLSVVEFLNAASATDLYVDVAGDTMTGNLITGSNVQHRAWRGSQLLPSYAFEIDADTGMFRTGTDILGLATGGVEFFRISRPQVLFGQTSLDGSSTFPTISFRADPNTGFYQPNNDELNVTVGGSVMLRLDNASSVTVNAPFHPSGSATIDIGSSAATFNALFASALYLRGGGQTGGSGPRIIGQAGASILITLEDDGTAIGRIRIQGATSTAGSGGPIFIEGGRANTTGFVGGSLNLTGGPSGSSTGGGINLFGGSGGNAGGNVQLGGGTAGDGSGEGSVDFVNPLSTASAAMETHWREARVNGASYFSIRASSDVGGTTKNYVWPNQTGTNASGKFLSTTGNVGKMNFTTVFTSNLLGEDGTADAPTYSFSSDPDTGISLPAAGRVLIGLGGASNLIIGTSELSYATTVGGVRFRVTTTQIHASTLTQQNNGGSESQPSYSFGGGATTGMYSGNPALGLLRFTSSGSTMLAMDAASAVSVLAPLRVQGDATPVSDITYNLGSSALRWNVVFASRISYTTLDPAPSATVSFPLLASPSGTDDAPAYSFSSESDAGMYLSASGHVSFSIGASQVMTISAGGVSLSSQFSTPAGTAGAPSYTFNADPDTGMYLVGTGFLGLAASGITIMSVNSDDVTFTRPLRAPNGSVGGPGIGFSSDTDNGLFLVTTNVVGFVAGGSTMLQIDNGSSVTVAAPLRMTASGQFFSINGSAGRPGMSFGSAQNTGIFQRFGIVQISSNASTMFRCAQGSAVTVLAPLHLADGSVANPGLTFAGDSDTGWYSQVSNQWSFISGGVHAFRMGVGDDVIFSSTQNISLQSGTAGAPTYSFAAGATNGMYLATTNTIGFVAAGETQFKIADGFLFSSNATIQTDFGTASTPAYTFNADPDVGMYRSGVNALGFAAAASTIMNVVSSTLSAVQPGTDLGANLGASSLRWNVVFASRLSYTTLDPVPAAEVSFPLFAPSGSAGAPSYSFEGASTMGITALFSDTQIGFGIGGVTRLRLEAGSLISSSLQYISKVGTPTSPTYSFAGTSQAGMFRAVTNGLGFSASGITTLTINHDFIRSSTANFEMPDGVVGEPSYSFINDTDTGMYLAGTGTLAFSASGDLLVSVSSAAVEIKASQLLIPNGSAGGPGIAIESDPNSGMYRVAADQLGFTAGGSVMLSLANGTGVRALARITNVGGTAAAPAYSFINDPDTGIYQSVPGELIISCSGQLMAAFQNQAGAPPGLLLNLGQYSAPNKSAANPSYSFWADVDTGMYLSGTGTLAFSASGDQVLTASSAAIEVKTAQLLVTNGSAGGPSIAFESDPDTGMYRDNINRLAFAASGVEIMRLAGSQILISQSGSAGAPGLAFRQDTDTGWTRTSGTLTTVVSGASTIVHRSTHLQTHQRIQVPFGSATTPSYTFEGFNSAGMFIPVAGALGFAVSGSTMLQMDAGSSITAIAPFRPQATNTFNLGTSTLRWDAMFASRVSATDLEGSLADVAERYSADRTMYDAGTVMIFGGPNEIMECYQMDDTRVAGVISANPFIKMNAKAGPDDTHPYLALKGRTGCKMKGPIGKGDLVTTSDKRGYGQAATEITPPWAVFAKSLEDSAAASAMIVVVVQ